MLGWKIVCFLSLPMVKVKVEGFKVKGFKQDKPAADFKQAKPALGLHSLGAPTKAKPAAH